MPSVPAKPFPLKLALLGAFIPALALAAALLNIRWGANPDITKPDALDLALPYVAVGQTLVWFLAWPAVAFARRVAVAPLWDLAVLAVGALPSFVAGCLFAPLPVAVVVRYGMFQGALALLALGLISAGIRHPRMQALMATVLATLALALPIVAYLCEEFLPAWEVSWEFVPLLAAARSATWYVMGGYAGVGLLLTMAARLGKAAPPAETARSS